jgi:hypothetical protein
VNDFAHKIFTDFTGAEVVQNNPFPKPKSRYTFDTFLDRTVAVRPPETAGRGRDWDNPG